MGAWLAPVSQVLTHASASLRGLDHEAGIMNNPHPYHTTHHHEGWGTDRVGI